MKILNNRDRKIISKSNNIIDYPASIENSGFMHLIFCQLGLPRSHCDKTIFERECGNLKIIVEIERSMNSEESNLFIPYGPAPRLLLMHICKQVTLLKKIEIDDLQKNHDFYFIWRKNSAFESLYRELVDEF